MLVAETADWRGTSGLIFTSVEDFKKYLVGVQFNGGWKPSNACLHCTQAPNEKQWDATTSSTDVRVDAVQRALNLTNYYKNADPASGKVPWLAGPHLFATSKIIMEFTPLNRRGTHSPNFNGTDWSMELVGDFNVEPFDGPRRDFAVGAFAAMCSVRGWDPNKLHLHRDDPAGHQDCPGKNVNKGEFIARVRAAMAGDDFNGHVAPPDAAPAPTIDLEAAVRDLQRAINALGVRNAQGRPIGVDGWPGGETRDAMHAAEKLLYGG